MVSFLNEHWISLLPDYLIMVFLNLGGIELSVYKAGPLSKNPMEMVGFSDFICIFAPSFRVLPFYSCNTKNREISDMIR